MREPLAPIRHAVAHTEPRRRIPDAAVVGCRSSLTRWVPIVPHSEPRDQAMVTALSVARWRPVPAGMVLGARFGRGTVPAAHR